MKPTQHQKIIHLMTKQNKKWFYPYDFMRPGLGDYYVGYKAPSRLSELNRKYPKMFIKDIDGRFVRYRINVQDFDEWYEQLPFSLKIYVKHPRRIFGHTF